MREPRFPALAKRRKMLAVGAAALGLVALAACNPAPDKKAQNIVIVGSDTTQTAVADLAPHYNASVKNTDPDTAINVLATQTSPLTVTADSQGDCPTTTYHSPPGAGEVQSPNGSSAGRDALKVSVANGDGCISVARSSAGPRAIGTTAGTDNSTFEYYAFALDAVGWGTVSTLAPASLTLAQLQGIYNCTYTNWSQVGGSAGPIKRYYPQAGSGTTSFFKSSVLGFDPLTYSSASCPSPVITEENTPGINIAANGDQQTAIAPMSAGVWSAQANGTYPDDRHGLVIKSLNGEPTAIKVGTQYGLNTPAFSGDSGAPVVESNVLLNNPSPAYPGIRYVFNVVDNTEKLYTQAMLMVGFTNASGGWKGDICSGAEASIIAKYFAPLDTSADGTHNAAGSNCRLYTP